MVGTYGREALPELFRLVDEVAAEVGTRGRGPNPGGARGRRRRHRLASSRVPAAAVRRRVMIVGLPFVYTLSLDQMRAVIAHELAHLTLGHVLIHRVTYRFVVRMEDQLLRMQEGAWFGLDPVYWSVRLSHAMLAGIYCPWERLREFDADRRSAMAAGANHAVAALRTARDHLPAMQSALAHVVEWCQANRTAPRHLGEAVARLAGAIPARARKDLGAGGGGRPVPIGGAQPPLDRPPHRRAPVPARQADSPPGAGSALPAGLAKPRGAPHQGGASNGGTPAHSRVGGADLGRIARPDQTGSGLRRPAFVEPGHPPVLRTCAPEDRPVRLQRSRASAPSHKLWADWALEGRSWAMASAHDVPRWALGEPIERPKDLNSIPGAST